MFSVILMQYLNYPVVETGILRKIDQWYRWRCPGYLRWYVIRSHDIDCVRCGYSCVYWGSGVNFNELWRFCIKRWCEIQVCFNVDKEALVVPFTRLYLQQSKQEYVITAIIKCGTKLRIHFKTSTVKTLKCENGWVISSRTYPGMWLLFHPGVKDKTC